MDRENIDAVAEGSPCNHRVGAIGHAGVQGGTGAISDASAQSAGTSNEERTAPVEQYSTVRAVVLHLAPGVVLGLFVLAIVPVLERRDIDPLFALFGGIGLVIVPLELAYLASYAHRRTGSWSPLAAVDYRNPMPERRVRLVAGLVVWFTAMLIVSIAVLDTWLADNVFAWLPDAILQFAEVDDSDEISGAALAALLVIAFAFNGIAGPVTEELYFRGHLLPRIERLGQRAPVLNTVLFGLYHLWTPWRWPTIILGYLPITWMTWRTRSVRLAIACHVTINITFLLLLLASYLSDT